MGIWPHYGGSSVRKNFLKFDDPVLFLLDLVLMLMMVWFIPFMLIGYAWKKFIKRN